jgi:hypothetical protein
MNATIKVIILWLDFVSIVYININTYLANCQLFLPKTLEDGIHTANLYKKKKSKQKVGTNLNNRLSSE